MHPIWQQELTELQPVLAELEAQLPHEFQPPRELVMRALETSPDDVRVVIVGQDPYPTPGHAIGLSFAVNDGVALPRSLNNMMKELRTDLADDFAAGRVTAGGDLARWADQGVLLLNRELTLPGNKLWQQVTDAALAALVRRREGRLVVVLWGNLAAKAEPAAAGAQVLRSAHPSPLSASRGFFGSRPYSTANARLEAMGLAPIDWSC